MKTPMQDLIEKLKSQKERQISLMKNQLMINTVDAVFTYAIENAESMLEQEKEVMCEFADQFAIDCINFHHEKTMSQEQFFNLTFHHAEWCRNTFNTQEK